MRRFLSICIAALISVFYISGIAQAATETTLSSMMQILQEEQKEAVFNIKLNAPFDKETSGIRETISVETGELLVTNEIFHIPGVNGKDISLELVYRSRDAKVYDEGTKSVSMSNSYGQNIIAYYDVFAANGYWLRTGALLYTKSETTILGQTTINGQSWIFTGYLQYQSGTAILSGANIQNALREKGLASAAKYIFGVGWSLNIPSLDVAGETICVNLPSGGTYLADFNSGIGLKDYELGDIVFTKDTSYSSGGIASAYKLYYVSGNAYYFSDDGRLLIEKDNFGNYIQYIWTTLNGLNLITQVVDSVGHYVNIRYDDLATYFITGERIKTLKKELLPGQVNKYCLSAFIDEEGRKFSYSYDFTTAAFDSLGKTVADNTYANLIEIIYPTGAKTEYKYQKSKKHLTTSRFMEYFKVIKRQDIEKEEILNRLQYNYYNEPDGFPNYAASAIPAGYKYMSEVVNDNGLVTRHIFNSQHQPYLKESSIADRLYEQVLTSYHLTQNMPQEIFTKTYNKEGKFRERTDIYQYDFRGNVISENHIDADPNSEKHKIEYTYSYEFNLPLTKVYKQDANIIIREEYDLTQDKKSVASIKVYSNDALLSNREFEYDKKGNVIQARTEQNKDKWAITQYEYGNEYNGAYPTAVIYKNVLDADGIGKDNKIGFTYDFARGLKLTETDTANQVISYNYDGLGRLLKEILPDGSYRTNEYDDERNIILATDAAGGRLKYYYSGFGNLLKVEEQESGNIIGRFKYDSYDNVIRSYDGNGNYRENSYDEVNRITDISHFNNTGSLLSNTGVSYDEAYTYKDGLYYRIQVTEKGNVENRVSSYYYDGDDYLRIKGRLIGDREERSYYSYDYLGNNIASTDFSGFVTKSSYDALGRLLESVDAAGSFFRYTYDQLGNLTSQTDALGQGAYYIYDALGRKIVSQLPYEDGLFSTTKHYYDGNGNLTERIDGEGYITKNHYNNRNFLSAVENELGENEANITKYEYDGEGRIVRINKGLNGWYDTEYTEETFEYDGLGRLLTRTDALGQKTTYTYDLNGNLLTSTDRNGVTVYYTYDGLNRQVRKENSKDRANNGVTYFYDLLGNITGMSDESGETSYSYDALGRVKSIDYTNGISQHYSYDSADRIIKLLVTQGSLKEMELSYRYDPAGRLTEVNDGGKSYSYFYDSNGRLIGQNNGVTGVLSEYMYFPSGNIRSLRHYSGEDIISNYEYTYDKRGNRITEREGQKETQYYYDALSRISIAYTSEDNIQTYTYDDFGNIQKMAEVKKTPLGNSLISESKYSYDKNNRLLWKETLKGEVLEELRFLYDNEGNQVKKEEIYKHSGSLLANNTLVFGYNGFNQLNEVRDKDNRSTFYTYNGKGLRTAKETAAETIKYYYDGNSNIILETDAENAVTAKNIRGLQLISRENAEKAPFYYLHDAHGDVTKLVDDLAKILKEYSYDPYGNEETAPPNPLGGNISSALWRMEAEEIDNPFRYCGEYLDSESGLIYLRARYYDPSTQRFISEDPIRAGFNWYTYCNNNPIKFVDPFGLDAILINKPVDNAANKVGIEHMGGFFQDGNDDWWFFYWGDTVQYVKVDNANIFGSLDKMNQWLIDYRDPKDSGLRLLNPENPYRDSVYIKGDFTASHKAANELRKRYTDSLEDWNRKGLPNRKYNVATRNCGQVTMELFMQGTLPSGTNVETYMTRNKYGVSVIPNWNMLNIQAIFYNKATNLTGFKDAIQTQRNKYEGKSSFIQWWYSFLRDNINTIN